MTSLLVVARLLSAYIIVSKNPSSLADVAWRPKHRFFSSKHRPEASTLFSGEIVA